MQSALPESAARVDLSTLDDLDSAMLEQFEAHMNEMESQRVPSRAQSHSAARGGRRSTGGGGGGDSSEEERRDVMAQLRLLARGEQEGLGGRLPVTRQQQEVAWERRQAAEEAEADVRVDAAMAAGSQAMRVHGRDLAAMLQGDEADTERDSDALGEVESDASWRAEMQARMQRADAERAAFAERFAAQGQEESDGELGHAFALDEAEGGEEEEEGGAPVVLAQGSLASGDGEEALTPPPSGMPQLNWKRVLYGDMQAREHAAERTARGMVGVHGCHPNCTPRFAPLPSHPCMHVLYQSNASWTSPFDLWLPARAVASRSASSAWSSRHCAS